jgi:hypothetical protein
MAADETLLARLAEAFATVDPVPEHVRAAARAAFGWRRLEATLAELTADSVEEAPSGVRGGDHRLLVFTGPDVAVEIEVTGDGPDREIVGKLAPPASADIAVRHVRGQVPARTDRGGHFVVPAIPAGPVSLVFQLADASSIVTSWVRL